MRAFRGVTLPGARRLSPGWLAVSIVGHAVFVVLLLKAYSGWQASDSRPTYAYLMNIPASPLQAVAVRAPEPPPALRGRPLVVPEASAAPSVPADPIPLGEGGAASEPGGLPGGRVGGRGRLPLTPQAGDARLYVRPMYLPGDGGRAISMDSLVRQRLLAMADLADSAMRSDSFRTNNAPPRWTFERNGQTYGMDSRFIYLGPIRIPTMVLALVPFPQGNIDQARANARLAEMRADILRAAARAEAEDDFRRAVEQIRARRDRERQEERDRRAREPWERPIP